MNLDCLNDVITNNLAINVDLTNIESWDLNPNYDVNSIAKWGTLKSKEIYLDDFGLTSFDNGQTNKMWGDSNLTTKDNLFKMYRVGYNNIINPDYYSYSGVSATTTYDGYEINAITSGSTGNYFDLNGGYLQGYFKLFGYDYEVLPTRYGNGITIELLLNIKPESKGIFYYMGCRSEDKYNPAFSGETINLDDIYSGVTTSKGNNLNAVNEVTQTRKAFKMFEERDEINYVEPISIDNLKNNVISFELTEDKRLQYKYIDENGFISTNISQTTINTTGFTDIAITFTPDNKISNPATLKCSKRREGTLSFYVNGRLKWVVDNFPEFYFTNIDNDPEKQIGVPYNISFGGGSFGLKHSWHYDYQTHPLFSGDSKLFIDNNYVVTNDPSPTLKDNSWGGVEINGLLLNSNDSAFEEYDEVNDVFNPITVMEIEYTGTTASTYFIKFDNPIYVLSNRDYTVSLSLYDTGLFDYFGTNEVSILVYSNESDINVIDEVTFNYADDHKSIWNNISNKFRTEDNLGKVMVNMGILIQSSTQLNLNEKIFIKDFKYSGADILTKDPNKNSLVIEENFDNSFIGGIQKMRIYTDSLTSQEILHNSIIESKFNNNIKVNKGGRIIQS